MQGGSAAVGKVMKDCQTSSSQYFHHDSALLLAHQLTQSWNSSSQFSSMASLINSFLCSSEHLSQHWPVRASSFQCIHLAFGWKSETYKLDDFFASTCEISWFVMVLLAATSKEALNLFMKFWKLSNNASLLSSTAHLVDSSFRRLTTKVTLVCRSTMSNSHYKIKVRNETLLNYSSGFSREWSNTSGAASCGGHS